MSWADLSAMLADAAQQPAIVLVCALCVIVAGIAAGLHARQSTESQEQDAGDTQAGWNSPPWPHPWEDRQP